MELPFSRVQRVLEPENMGTSSARKEPSLEDSVKLRIHFDDLRHPAIGIFLAVVDSTNILKTASEHVFHHLYRSHGKPQAVRSITLILESMDGVAYTTGLPIDDLHKEIHLSLDYIARKLHDPLAFQKETIGVIVHEMVHCWQHNGCGTAPGGLIEGIADYVRLKSGLAPPHWQKSREECGRKWDEGYQKTAWFLEWLEDQHGEGLISRINAYMDGKKYDEKSFWNDICGESVDELWKKYLKHWDDAPASANGKAGSETSESPEVIEYKDADIAAVKQDGKQAKPFQS